MECRYGGLGKVLRIECQGITPTEISKALRAINIYAQELE